ncbi:hypothetical protein LV85_01758 [Algoriphagus chordae]|uniref:HMA domain-containing protein n=1 Tax=Algoriphagus chordae TaxID=237019 RepID=A0A2W7R4W7_9BACT|nr:hypothetical protein LV85_01758 [Algoriphagus chordae]
MSSRNLSILIFSLALCLISCNSKGSFERNTLIVPQIGCTTCVKIGKELAAKNPNNPCLDIVFTKIQSYKSLKIEMGYDFFDLANVYVDSIESFSDIVSSFPVLILNDSILEINAYYLSKTDSLTEVLQQCDH